MTADSPTPAGRRPGRRLALAATLLAAVVVLLGAYTRLTHAGLGCPDWPGCYGFLGIPSSAEQQALASQRFPEAPVEADKAWNEMIHRYFAAALGLLVLALAIGAVRRPDGPRRLPLLLLGLVLVQALFGMWTVTLRLWPQVVTLHLLGGMATLALLFLLTLRLSPAPPPCNVPPALRRLARVALLLCVAQIALGGWVSANYAAVACVEFPTCQGLWWPEMDFGNGFHLTQDVGPNYLGGLLFTEARTAIHVSHRLGALVLALTLLALVIGLLRHGLLALGAALLLALVVQLAIGIALVLLKLPLALALAHSAGAALLLLTLVTVNVRLHQPRVARPAPLGAWSAGRTAP